MIEGVIPGVPVVIQGGVILEVIATALICHEVEAAVGVGVEVPAIVGGAGLPCCFV